MRKDFELPSFFETSSESELLSNNDLLSWFVSWVIVLRSYLTKK